MGYVCIVNLDLAMEFSRIFNKERLHVEIESMSQACTSLRYKSTSYNKTPIGPFTFNYRRAINPTSILSLLASRDTGPSGVLLALGDAYGPMGHSIMTDVLR